MANEGLCSRFGLQGGRLAWLVIIYFSLWLQQNILLIWLGNCPHRRKLRCIKFVVAKGLNAVFGSTFKVTEMSSEGVLIERENKAQAHPVLVMQ